MNWTEKKSIRIAILDMYEGFANQRMRCIREILNQFGEANHLDLTWDEFEVRLEKQVPDLSYDIYISTGGPGSPLESEGNEWEKVYFNWQDRIKKIIRKSEKKDKKHHGMSWNPLVWLG